MTQTYDQVRAHHASHAHQTAFNKPKFSGRLQRGVLAYLLEHGVATDHDMQGPLDAGLLSVRSVIYDLRNAGLLQVADPAQKKTKPYGLTRAGAEIALAQEGNTPFVFYSPPSPRQ